MTGSVGTPAERQNEYRALFRAVLDDGFVNGLRAATMAAGRLATRASSDKSPMRSAAGLHLCQGTVLPRPTATKTKYALTPISPVCFLPSQGGIRGVLGGSGLAAEPGCRRQGN